MLPLLYLHGLSSSDFGPALEQFLGSGAGLSAATITRLTGQWPDDSAAFGKRSLAGTDYVNCWVDGIHLKVRLEQDKVCLLVMIGVRADGTKELVALAGGFRESWADLLRDCKRRGMRAAIHRIDLTQALSHSAAKDYLGRRAEQGATHKEAMRSLKRRLSDVVYRAMLADAQLAADRQDRRAA